MKKIDIRKIYLGEILKQTEVRERPYADITHAGVYSYWEYEKETQLGLFVRTLGGYKHILTGKFYPKPSKRTGKKHVINPDNIKNLIKCESDLCSKLVNKYQSYYLDLSLIKKLEEKVITDAKIIEQNSKLGIL